MFEFPFLLHQRGAEPFDVYPDLEWVSDLRDTVFLERLIVGLKQMDPIAVTVRERRVYIHGGTLSVTKPLVFGLVEEAGAEPVEDIWW